MINPEKNYTTTANAINIPLITLQQQCKQPKPINGDQICKQIYKPARTPTVQRYHGQQNFTPTPPFNNYNTSESKPDLITTAQYPHPLHPSLPRAYYHYQCHYRTHSPLYKLWHTSLLPLTSTSSATVQDRVYG